jgi:TolB-like protein
METHKKKQITWKSKNNLKLCETQPDQDERTNDKVHNKQRFSHFNVIAFNSAESANKEQIQCIIPKPQITLVTTDPVPKSL